jgi:hypothetical protein
MHPDNLTVRTGDPFRVGAAANAASLKGGKAILSRLEQVVQMPRTRGGQRMTEGLSPTARKVFSAAVLLAASVEADAGASRADAAGRAARLEPVPD